MSANMSEIHFIVEEAAEGGYVARAVGADIVTEADDLASLREQVRDAVRCHFGEPEPGARRDADIVHDAPDAADRPGLIRLHITREEALPV
jgi:hypothetical protein